MDCRELMLGMPPYWRPSNKFCTARVASFPNLKGECNDASPKADYLPFGLLGELFAPHIELFDLTARQLFDLNVRDQFAPIFRGLFALLLKSCLL